MTTRMEMKALAALVTLRGHIVKEMTGSNMLVGAQWCLVEVITIPAYDDVPERKVAKIIGSDNSGKMQSAPIDYWKERQFCGIHYYHSASIMKPDVRAEVIALQSKTTFEYAWYNPYQDRLLPIAPLAGKGVTNV
jgi:hypothetical protein